MVTGKGDTEILSLPPVGIPTPAYSYVKTVFYIEEEKMLNQEAMSKTQLKSNMGAMMVHVC